MKNLYQERFYRKTGLHQVAAGSGGLHPPARQRDSETARLAPKGLCRFEVKIRESDLLIFAENSGLQRAAPGSKTAAPASKAARQLQQAAPGCTGQRPAARQQRPPARQQDSSTRPQGCETARQLEALAYQALGEARSDIEHHIERDGEFARTLAPYQVEDTDAPIVRSMASASASCGVGPMASVAGAIAEYVGRALLTESRSVIVENGGDVFLALSRPATLHLYAGEDSPFTDRVRLQVPNSARGLGVCTSSGQIGPSLSFGSADAVVAVAKNCAYADASATAIANRVHSPEDVAQVVQDCPKEFKLRGLVVAAGDRIGFWGDIKLI